VRVANGVSAVARSNGAEWDGALDDATVVFSKAQGLRLGSREIACGVGREIEKNTSLKDEIQAINTRYAAALAAGGTGVGQFFTDDADLLPPGQPNLKGPAAIEAFWRAAVEGAEKVTLTTLDAASLGSDYVREIGEY